jgi:hypothetical protein
LEPGVKKLPPRLRRQRAKGTVRMPSIDVPKLPIPYSEARSTSVDLAERFAPEFLELLSATFGWHLRPISARDRKQMTQRLRRTLLGMRGYLLGLELLEGSLAPALARYALFEGITREQLKAGGQKFADGDGDACLVLLARLEKMAAPHRSWIRIPGHEEARSAVDGLVNELAPHARDETFSALAKAWSESDDAKKLIHFAQRFPALVRGWRCVEPKRLTQQLVVKLTNQYRDCAGVFEQYLRRFVAFDRATRGISVRWSAFHQTMLANLVEMAGARGASEHVLTLAQGINREVRNVLAHGHATVNMRDGVVEFRSERRIVIAWTPVEFFDATWLLTANVFAMLKFDEQLQLVAYRTTLERLAGDVRSDRAPVQWWTPDRALIHRWMTQHSGELAALYHGAVRLLDGPADVSSRLRFIAHAVREIRNRLPDAVAPVERRRLNYNEHVEKLRKSLGSFNWSDGDSTAGPLPTLSQDLLRELIDAHERVAEANVDAALRLFKTATRSSPGDLLRPLARDWHEIGEWFMHDVHINTKAAQAQTEAQYRVQFRRFETILRTLAADFFSPIAKLDAILADPKSRLDDALLHVGHEEQLKYFFDKLDRPDWVRGLAKKRFFQGPPPPTVEENGEYIYFPRWPALKFLVRVADREPEGVLDAVRGMPNTDNLSVRADLLEVARRLPARQAAVLTTELMKWLRGDEPFHMQIEHRLEPLLGHLADGREVAIAEKLLSVAARVSAPKSDYSPPVIRMPVWSYDRLVRNNLDLLLAADGPRFFAQFVRLLRAAVKCGLSSYERTTGRDSSSGWRDAIETTSGHVDDPRDVLVEAVRDAALRLATDANSLTRVLVDLEKQTFSIFQRIALHIALERTGLASEEAVKRVMMPSLFDNADVAREYARLLAVTYPILTDDQKNVILGWIEKGPDLSYMEKQRVDAEGAPSLDDPRRERRERWQLGKLALIADAIDEEWGKRHAALREKYGQPDDPRSYRPHDVWVGPTTPFDSEELKALDVDALVEKLRNWAPPSGWMVPTPSGVGVQLATLVAELPDKYAATEKFTVLEPTYVRAVIDGFQRALSAGRDIPWEGTLTLLEWILKQPFDVDSGDPRDRDVGWTSARSSAARLMADAFVRKFRLPFLLRQRAWAVIERLLGDADPSEEDEDTRVGRGTDAAELSINATRSVALDAALRYGAWVRDNLGAPAVRSFDAIPELRDVLGQHLDRKERSRAVRFVYGRWFRFLAIDKGWIRDHLSDIFGAGNDADELGETAWDGFISTSEPGRDDYKLLAAYYTRAVDRIGKGPPTVRRLNTPERALAHHLARLYWSSVIELDDPSSPLHRFYQVAPIELRAHLADFVGRALHRTKIGDVPTDVAARLRTFWEVRIGALVGQPPAERDAELAAFGWWFAASNLGAEWLLEHLLAGLQMHPHVEPSLSVVERLASLAPDHPVAALGCLDLMVRDDAVGWHIESWKQNAKIVLRVALADLVAKDLATKLVNELGRRGFHDYGGLLAASDGPPTT